MEIFGLHEYIRDVATRRVAKLGALAVAPDYYFRKGDRVSKVTDTAQTDAARRTASPDTELFSDLRRYQVAWAKQQGGDTANRLGIMGFCRGGRTVWLYSTHNPSLKAGVAIYGSLGDQASAAMPKNALARSPPR